MSQITLIGSSGKPAFLGLSSRRVLSICLASFSDKIGEVPEERTTAISSEIIKKLVFYLTVVK